MARKRKYLDRKLVKDLCLAQLSTEEIATCLRVDRHTIERRFGTAIKKWKEDGVAGVRRKLYMTAMGESKAAATCMIFFLKNFGGMKDVVENTEPKRLEFNGLPVPNDEPARVNKPN